MSVCISKGNEFTEVLQDTVAVELQGFVRLLIYDLISPNVPSLQPYLVIQQSNLLCYFVFILKRPFFFSICSYHTSGL